MILGIGTDIVSVSRMQRAWHRWGDRLSRRILSLQERKTADVITPALLAKRFAAKEAVLKALGAGLRAGISLQEITVGHNAAGAPIIEVTGAAQRRCQQRGATAIHITIADENHYAVAFAVIETR